VASVISAEQTCSPRPFVSATVVNNLRRQNGKTLDRPGFFALFAAGSPASSGEQAVHINSLSVYQTGL
jgi:hypothetical protein